VTKPVELSILDELRRGGGYEFSFAATFNAYPPFYEEVLLPYLNRAGCRANVLVMDGRQCGAALSDTSARPLLAGRKYTLLPVRARGAFHPKLLLLVGRDKARLYVGSHNVTLAGFSHNRELTNRFEAEPGGDSSGLSAVAAAWRFLRTWVEDQPEDLLTAFDAVENYAAWLREAVESETEAETETQFFGATPEGPPLWEVVGPRLPRDVSRITLVSPFFDGRLRFLKRLAEQFSPAEFIVGVEPGAVEIGHDAHAALPSVRFVDAARLREGRGYLHAKAVLFETKDGREALLTGSANASWQAWLAGTGERNAEAVVLTQGDGRRSQAKALGLKALAKEPVLQPEVWDEIRRRTRASVGDRKGTHPAPLVAVETEAGFEVVAEFEEGSEPTSAELFDATGRALGVFEPLPEEGGFYRVDVPEVVLRGAASSLVLRRAGGSNLIAIIHHTFDVAASAQSDRQRELRHAMASLETDSPMLEEMLRIVERVIFDDFDPRGYRPRASGGRGAADERAADATEEPQTTFAAPQADRQRRRGQQVSADDLTLLLDALNRRLGVGLEASVEMGPSIARSEEELVGSEDESNLEEVLGREIDGAALAALCRKKVATLMRRMTGQLGLAAQSEARAAGAVRQLAAVLGILHRLREVEAEAEWVPYGEVLIKDRDEWKFFLDATRLLYSRRAAVMEHAVRAYKEVGERRASSAPREPSLAAALLLWLAWDSGLDVRTAVEPEDRDETQENLRGVARLVAMAAHIAADAAARDKAAKAVGRHCSNYEADGLTETWLNAHISWIEKLSDSRAPIRNATPPGRMPDVGDLVYLNLKKGEARPMVVLQQRGTSVRVVDLDEEDEQKGYGIKFVNLIHF
jgi:hypothetical protein